MFFCFTLRYTRVNGNKKISQQRKKDVTRKNIYLNTFEQIIFEKYQTILDCCVSEDFRRISKNSKIARKPQYFPTPHKGEECSDVCSNWKCAFCSVSSDIPGFCCSLLDGTGCLPEMLEAIEFLPANSFQCVMPSEHLARLFMWGRAARDFVQENLTHGYRYGHAS